MKLVISDLEDKQIHELVSDLSDDSIIISKDHSIKQCIGCFGCWIKTPGSCVIHDTYEDMGKLMAQSEEVHIISQCCYGGFSPFVKNVLDRSIAYVHPYFVIKNGEMHHRRRYQDSFDLRVWFYGENITDKEKSTAQKLIKANAVNLYCHVSQVFFLSEKNLMEGIINESCTH